MEVPKAVALVAALALVALGALATRWLQRMEARNEEVRRLALLAAAEEETIAREEAYYYGQYGGFVRSSDLPEAPSLWAAQEGPPAPKEVMAEAAAAAAATVASPTAGKGVCAMCSKPTTLRCKRCKSVKYWSVSSRHALVLSLSLSLWR
jgi:ubiquitin carboxyl-terminal hydrolase 36/42